MLRVPIILLNSACALLAVIIATLWADSYAHYCHAFHSPARRVNDPITYTEVVIEWGRVQMNGPRSTGTYQFTLAEPSRWEAVRLPLVDPDRPSTLGLLAFFWHSSEKTAGKATLSSWTVAVPLWVPLLLALTPPALTLRARRRRRRLARVGLCPTCQYDLRGTPNSDRCPECGTPIARPGG